MDKNSILDIEVSCFTNYDTPSNPKPVNLLTWITSRKYAEKVERIRATKDKEDRDILKAELPAITPSGTFTYRAASKLVKHSGFIQFDIDLKKNEGITNYDKLKAQVQNIQNVAYAGLSVSGTGYWGLLPIAYPEKHKQHFKALQEDFASFGIVIDKACKDVSRLRGYSYDQEGYFNHSAKVYERYIEPPKPKPVKHTPNCEILSDAREIYQRLRIWAEKKGSYADGNKYIFIRDFACALNRYGVDQYTATELLKADYLHAASYVNPEDYDNIVNAQYRAYSSQHNTQSFELSIYKPSNTRRQQLPPGWKYESFTRFDGVVCRNLINADGYPAMWDITDSDN